MKYDLSILLSVLPSVQELYHYFFLNFGMMLGTHVKWCVTAEFSRKIIFAPKIGKMGQKQDFLNILKNFVINFY